MNQHTDWEKEFRQTIAQASPVTFLKRYKDADFDWIKEFIAHQISLSYRKGYEDAVEAIADQYNPTVEDLQVYSTGNLIPLKQSLKSKLSQGKE